jgi:RNA polymerase sigma factor (sigma-70 family)
VVTDDFEAFVWEQFPSMVRTVALAIGDNGVAEDATQEAFVKASVRWHRVVRMERPVGWVYVVALNAARRALKRRPVPSEMAPRVEQDAEPRVDTDHAAAVVTRLDVHDALAALAPRQRAVAVLRYLADLSVAETAPSLGVTESTVKSTTRDALANLRVVLEGAEDG